MLKLLKLELWESSHQSSLSKHNGQFPAFMSILLWIALLKSCLLWLLGFHWWSLPPTPHPLPSCCEEEGPKGDECPGEVSNLLFQVYNFSPLLAHLFCPTGELLSWQIRTCCINPGLWQQSLTQFQGNQSYSFLLHNPKFTAEHQLCVSMFGWTRTYVDMTNTNVLFSAASLCKL